MEKITDGLYINKDFVTQEIATKYINLIDKLRTTNDRKFASGCDFYNAVFKDTDIASLINDKVINCIPNVVSVAPYITFARYIAGEDFGMHTDTGCVNHAEGNETGYTLLIYLNDNFEGGMTSFYNSSWEQIAMVKPITGMAVIFDIDMLHMAHKVESGQKYWFGADLMIALTHERLKLIQDIKYS